MINKVVDDLEKMFKITKSKELKRPSKHLLVLRTSSTRLQDMS